MSVFQEPLFFSRSLIIPRLYILKCRPSTSQSLKVMVVSSELEVIPDLACSCCKIHQSVVIHCQLWMQWGSQSAMGYTRGIGNDVSKFVHKSTVLLSCLLSSGFWGCPSSKNGVGHWGPCLVTCTSEEGLHFACFQFFSLLLAFFGSVLAGLTCLLELLSDRVQNTPKER